MCVVGIIKCGTCMRNGWSKCSIIYFLGAVAVASSSYQIMHSFVALILTNDDSSAFTSNAPVSSESHAKQIPTNTKFNLLTFLKEQLLEPNILKIYGKYQSMECLLAPCTVVYTYIQHAAHCISLASKIHWISFALKEHQVQSECRLKKFAPHYLFPLSFWK